MAIKLSDGTELDVINEKSSFWQLIDKYSVKIPDLQRDYAYGRDIKRDNIKSDKENVSGDESTKIIRETFVHSAKEALERTSRLNLNFLYGAKHGGESYSPIDGQQRLTTLFVIHWYVFQRVSDYPSLDVLKNKFSYATRDTSERFCSNICQDLNIDFSAESISEQISDCSWFADNFSKDPTVWSMLVVMDSVHTAFSSLSTVELNNFACELKNPNCMIDVETLTVPSLGNEEDLYIKMNGRGKQLSDFEIFKSLLQNSKELNAILGGSPSALDISNYIGRFNTEYSKVFNSLIGDPLLVEGTLYYFIRNYLMCSYFARVSQDGVKEEQYRLDCGKFRFFNGKVLFEFFTNPDYFLYYSKMGKAAPKDINMSSFKNIESILSAMSDCFSAYGKVDIDSKYFDLKDRIVGLSRERHMSDDFIDYALFEFIRKFGYPKNPDEKETFIFWKRFVFNISNNIDLKGSNESLVKIIRVIDEVIQNITSYSEISVLQSVKMANGNALLKNVMLMKPQFDEESIKADLVLNDKLWKDSLIEAEDYYTGGQIGFLLQMAQDSFGKYDIIRFRDFFNASKSVWKSDKSIDPSVDGNKLAKAFLCALDNTSKKTSQLVQINSDTYEIPISNYVEVMRNYTDKNKNDKCAQWDILKDLLLKVSSGKTVDDSCDDMISSKGTLDYWKECFINNDLFGTEIGDGVIFSDYVFFLEHDLLLLSKQSVRSRNMSLKTLMLYREMISSGMKGDLIVHPTQEVLDDKGNPHRTIAYKGNHIGFNSDTEEYVIIENGITKKSMTDVMVEIKKL